MPCRNWLAVFGATLLLAFSPSEADFSSDFGVGLHLCSTGSSAVDLAGAWALGGALTYAIVAGQFWATGMLRTKPA